MCDTALNGVISKSIVPLNIHLNDKVASKLITMSCDILNHSPLPELTRSNSESAIEVRSARKVATVLHSESTLGK
jgi:hypothetical protein